MNNQEYFKEIYRRSMHLRPVANYSIYPPYHEGHYLEEYFLDHYLNLEVCGRILIPIFWTNCYLQFVSGIQEFLNTLDPNKSYFTVSQHDDAIRERLPKDTITFSAGGNAGQIPIPLICSALHDIRTVNTVYGRNERTVICSFVGSYTHPVRTEMCNTLNNIPGFVLNPKSWSDKVQSSELERFIDLTSKSEFALCPRGYGRTSFRLYEVMQLGAIPIYIYDDIPWLPFTDELNWSEFSVVIHVSQLKNLPDTLNNISQINRDNMRARMTEVYNDYFTLEGMSKNIMKRI